MLRKPDSENRGRHIAGHGSESWGKLDEDLPDEKTPGQQFKQFLRSLTIFWAENQEPKKPPYHLVVPGKRRDADGLTQWVANQWIPFWGNVQSISQHLKTPLELTQKTKSPNPTDTDFHHLCYNHCSMSSYCRHRDTRDNAFNGRSPGFHRAVDCSLCSGTYVSHRLVNFPNGDFYCYCCVRL